MDKDLQVTIDNLVKRNISVVFCKDRITASNELLNYIPADSSIGISGSVTLDELGIVASLEVRGNKVFNQYKLGIERQESVMLRQLGVDADYYLTSANAISRNGELVFLSAWGHRISGISNGKKVICVCGINKITQDLESALKRAKEYATSLNYKRLNWDKQKRMICQTLIIDAEAVLGRFTVFLVAENLGF
jgi:hypothetical protein